MLNENVSGVEQVGGGIAVGTNSVPVVIAGDA